VKAPAVRWIAGAVLALGLLAFGAKWIAGSTATELARHYSEVVEPLVATEMDLVDDLAPLANDPRALVERCESAVLPSYRKHLATAKRFVARDSAVRRLNDVLIEEYHGAISQLEAWVQAARDERAPDAKRAATVLASLDMTRLRQALEKAYCQHGVRPADL
jgi:hypothetical protein